MQLLDLTLSDPAENLALDEALLAEAEDGQAPDEVLRLWEFAQPVVVIGRSSRVAQEVNLQVCRRRNIPVFRRSSGGAAVVGGPGCLMYTVVLSNQHRPGITMISAAHRVVLETVLQGLRPLHPDWPQLLNRRGTSDLALGEQKISGNSMRIVRSHVLYHGTLLYDFPLDLIEELLDVAPRQPDYRAGRTHRAFVGNLPTDALALREALIAAWSPTASRTAWPVERVRTLVEEQYGQDEWNLKR